MRTVTGQEFESQIASVMGIVSSFTEIKKALFL